MSSLRNNLTRCASQCSGDLLLRADISILRAIDPSRFEGPKMVTSTATPDTACRLSDGLAAVILIIQVCLSSDLSHDHPGS